MLGIFKGSREGQGDGALWTLILSTGLACLQLVMRLYVGSLDLTRLIYGVADVSRWRQIA